GMKSVQDAFDLFLKNEGFDKVMMYEADKYSAEKRFLVLNAECEMTARTLYDFSKDSKWVKLNEELKAREKLLKAIQPGTEVADTDTGEILSCPIKGVSRYLKIKL
ncbi:hypothetical protein, partial [Neomegalonema sp.]|uniref:hypothetical protein n=1 Tax=Neomegalonema sp. TaxID=2039713 RepID=UPI00260D00D7